MHLFLGILWAIALQTVKIKPARASVFFDAPSAHHCVLLLTASDKIRSGAELYIFGDDQYDPENEPQPEIQYPEPEPQLEIVPVEHEIEKAPPPPMPENSDEIFRLPPLRKKPKPLPN